MTLHRLLRTTLGFAALAGCLAATQAAPVTARFSGQVSGYEFGFLDPAAVAMDEDAPVGTPVSWVLNFDDSFLALSWNDLPVQGAQAITGSMQVGGRAYRLESLGFFSVSLAQVGTGWEISSYRAQIGGTGPGTSDGADFFTMLFSWDRSLSLVENPMIGYGYQSGLATVYGYLDTSGDYSLEHGGTVPEPSTLLLAVPALAWLGRRRRAG